MEFEQIIGLEVHCELKTNSKMFSSAPVTFGKEPNSMMNEIDMGMLGTMPVLNKRSVELAIRVCHALHMDIDEVLCFDRKNYYYADLPKGFQITQYRRPLGKNGYLDIEVDHVTTRIQIERLHLEEDTAKQNHYNDYSLIDYNRAGIPLIEIVTCPDIRNAKQAAAYLEKLRQIFLYTDISDAKMEEGSMRCDVNISLRPFGCDSYGTRTEIKNVNSISYVQKAIEFEAKRHEELLKCGKSVLQETRRFDETINETITMRTKSDAIDYRYYPEVNILPIHIDHQWVLDIKKQLPLMAEDREKIYIEKHGLSKREAHFIVSSKEISDFYEETIQFCQDFQKIYHWLSGEVQSYLNNHHCTIYQTKLKPIYLSQLIQYIKEDVISSQQSKQVFDCVMKEGKAPEVIIQELDLRQILDSDVIEEIVNHVLDVNASSIQDYIQGKKKVIGFLMGQIMKESKGQVNPKMANQILIQSLQKRTQ